MYLQLIIINSFHEKEVSIAFNLLSLKMSLKNKIHIIFGIWEAKKWAFNQIYVYHAHFTENIEKVFAEVKRLLE